MELGTLYTNVASPEASGIYTRVAGFFSDSLRLLKTVRMVSGMLSQQRLNGVNP